jgi:hypothetical protein
VFDWRVYRAAMVPLVLALLVSAFSLGDLPPPRTSTLAPDAFDGTVAFNLLGELSAAYPDRRPGSEGDRVLARFVVHAFRTATFNEHLRRFSGQTIDGQRQLETAVGTRAGVVNDQIVLLAHRDAAHRGSMAELSGTAALLELAHVLSGRVTQHTVTLVSTTGGSGGDAGAVDFARRTGGPVDAVIVLGDLASTHRRSPVVVPWSEQSGMAPVRLRRTLDWAVAMEVGRPAGQTSPAGQFARLAFPLTITEQGPLLVHGLAAETLQASGERGPASGAPVDEATLQGFGRAALRTLNALDTSPRVDARTDRGLVFGHRVFPSWAVWLVSGALLLAPVLAAVDGFARGRRRRSAGSPGVRWALTLVFPFLLTAAVAAVFGRLGVFGATPATPVLPSAVPVQGGALAGVGAVFVLSWLLRGALLRRLGVSDPKETARAPATGPVILLILCLLALIVWVANPYAALLVIPALHLWLVPLAHDVRMRRWLAVALVLVGAAPVALLAVGYLTALGLNPVQGLWVALMLVAGGHMPVLSALVWSLMLGGGVAVLMIAARRAEDEPAAPLEVTVRGPVSYAGPGSLGGTESALRR